MLGFSTLNLNKSNKKSINFFCVVENAIGSVNREEQSISP